MNQVVDITDLRERHLDMMIKLAFDLDDAEETQRLLNEPDAELSAEDERLADEILAAAFQKADERAKAQRWQQRRASIRHAMPRLALIASCLILALTIAAPIAIASSPVLRSRVMRLLIQVDEEQGRATFEFAADPDAAFDVPEGWEGEYCPSYIPDGFSVWNIEQIISVMEYRPSDDPENPDDYRQLFFGEFDDEFTGYSGTDNTDISYIDIQGRTGMLIDGYTGDLHTVNITWANDTNWFFVVGYAMDTDVVIEVARSVRKIVE